LLFTRRGGLGAALTGLEFENAIAEVIVKNYSKIETKELLSPMAREAGMVRGAKAGVRVGAYPVFIGMAEEVGGGLGTVCHVVEYETVAIGRFGDGRGGCFVWISAKKEAMSESTDAAEVVDSKGKEEYLLVDKILKDSNIGASAIDRKLRLFCLMMLGSSGYRCR